MADKASAEEVYSRCLGNASILDAAARRFADSADAASAVACAWGADVYAAQAVLWERIMIAASSPQRQFFRVADALVSGLQVSEPSGGQSSAATQVETSRRALLEACDPDLRDGMRASWSDIGYLAGVPATTASDLEDSVARRLGGRSPEAFVTQRRLEATESMATAQALRIKGEGVPAIQAAYDGDLSALEAYLVESAVAAGDTHLLTVTVRWSSPSTRCPRSPACPRASSPPSAASATRWRPASAMPTVLGCVTPSSPPRPPAGCS